MELVLICLNIFGATILPAKVHIMFAQMTHCACDFFVHSPTRIKSTNFASGLERPFGCYIRK